MEKYITISEENNNLLHLAEQYGYLWSRIKEHPNNARLFERCPDHQRLPVGEQLFMPKRKTKAEPLELYTTNRFVIKRNPRYLSVYLHWPDKKPIADAPYELHIGKFVEKGRSTSDGLVEQPLLDRNTTQARLIVYPYPQYPQESMLWIINFNQYAHKDDTRGNLNYLTLHRHILLQSQVVKPNIIEEAESNIPVNQKQHMHSALTALPSERNFYPRLFPQALAHLKLKHHLRLLEQNAAYSTDQLTPGQKLTWHDYSAIICAMQDAETLSHEYAISGDMLHQALAELDKQAGKRALPFQSKIFKQERTRLFEALLKADKKLAALNSREALEQYQQSFDSRLQLFNECALPTHIKTVAQGGKAWSCVHAFDALPLQLVYADNPQQPVSNSIVLYWPYSDQNPNKLATENTYQYDALNIMLPMGMGFTDAQGYLSQSIPHISPHFASAQWLGLSKNELYANLKTHQLLYLNNSLSQLREQIARKGDLSWYETLQKTRLNADEKRLNQAYSFWPDTLIAHNRYLHWNRHVIKASELSYWGGLGKANHSPQVSDPMPQPQSLSTLPTGIPYEQIDTLKLSAQLKQTTDEERQSWLNFSKKFSNKLFYKNKKYGFIILPPNALNFKTRDLLALAEQSISDSELPGTPVEDKAAFSGVLSPGQSRNGRQGFAPLKLYCTLPQWGRRLRHIMQQLRSQLKKKSLLLAPHIQCATRLDLMENFAGLSCGYPYDNERSPALRNRKQHFVQQARHFNRAVFDALNKGWFSDTKEQEKTEQLARELVSLLEQPGYLYELRRFIKHLSQRSEAELASGENCSLYFEVDSSYMMPFQIIQDAYALLAQTQYGMSGLFYKGHIVPALEALSENPEVIEYFDQIDEDDFENSGFFDSKTFHESSKNRLLSIQEILLDQSQQRAEQAKGPLSIIFDWYQHEATGFSDTVKSHFMNTPGPPPTAMLILNQWGAKYISRILQDKTSTAHLRLFLSAMQMLGFIKSKEDMLASLRVISRNREILKQTGRLLTTKAKTLDAQSKLISQWPSHQTLDKARATEELLEGMETRNTLFLRSAVQLVTLANAVEGLLNLPQIYRDYQHYNNKDNTDIILITQTFTQSAEIFAQSGLALHTARTTLHRLNRVSPADIFKPFIMDNTTAGHYAGSAERLAAYVSIFSLVNSSLALWHEAEAASGLKLKGLTQLRDIIFSTATLTGYLMEAAGKSALLEGISWLSVWGARLLRVGGLWGLVITLAWEGTVGILQAIQNYQHKIAELMSQEGEQVRQYFENNKGIYHKILQSPQWQTFYDQSSYDLLEWLGQDKGSIAWGKLNWRAAVPAYELGLDTEQINYLVDFPLTTNTALYPLSAAQYTRLQHWLKTQPPGNIKTFYKQVSQKRVIRMSVKAIIWYYQQLLAYPQQDEILAGDITYAQLAERLRRGVFTPPLNNPDYALSQYTLYDNSNQPADEAHYYYTIRLLQFDQIKVQQAEDKDRYLPSLITPDNDNIVYSWHHPVFRNYI